MEKHTKEYFKKINDIYYKYLGVNNIVIYLSVDDKLYIK
jgi:hypothetical protein